MLSERDGGYLEDILRHLLLAEEFTRDYTEDGLNDDPRTLFAVSDEVKERHPKIRWEEMAAAGNFYRHDYGQITTLRVWKTLCDDIPALRIAVEQELSKRP